MKILGKQLPSFETVGIFLSNLFRPEKEKKPLVAAYCLTFKCNARCAYCSQRENVYGNKQRNYNGDIEVEKRFEVLRTIRRDVPNIFFVGGEPTVYPGLGRILEECVNLRFDTIGVNTNGLIFKPEILKNANLLVVSLHSINPAKIASVYGVAPKWGVQVLENIKRYANERDDSALQMKITCVITGENIGDVYEIAEFCRDLGIRLNVTPAILDGGRPDMRLVGNIEYKSLINWLMSQNGLIATSRTYLEIIKNFEPFACTPHIIPCIHPNGDMTVPCPHLPEGPEMINVVETGGVNEALRIARARFEVEHGIWDTRMRCSEMCHKTCYVEGSGISTICGVARFIREKISLHYKQ